MITWISQNKTGISCGNRHSFEVRQQKRLLSAPQIVSGKESPLLSLSLIRIPVVIHGLHVIVHIQKIQKTVHLLDVFLVG